MIYEFSLFILNNFTLIRIGAIVQHMNNKEKNQDYLNVLRKIYDENKISQRRLAKKLGFSLGKLNYCIKALKNKGYIKVINFKQNPRKLNYAYILTPKGIMQKTNLTMSFMKRKMEEYDELKKELKNDENTFG